MHKYVTRINLRKFNANKHNFDNENWGKGRGKGHYGRRRRGRPNKLPKVEYNWKPVESENMLDLYDYELEVLRLIDLEGFTQEEVAQKLKPVDDSLSRGNINRYLQNARKKVVKAMLQSEKITIRVIKTQKKTEEL